MNETPKFAIGGRVEVLDASGAVLGIGKIVNVIGMETKQGKKFRYFVWLLHGEDMTVDEDKLRGISDS